MTRRSDTALRKSISQIEEMLLANPSKETVFSRCTALLMQLFDARYGYTFRCRDSDSQGIPWEMVSCQEYNGHTLHTLSDINTSTYLPTADKELFKAGKCYYANLQPFDHLICLPHDHPEINNLLCIPLSDARYIHGVIYLCNKPGGFDESMVSRIRPFTAAANCILRATQPQCQQTLLAKADISPASISSLPTSTSLINCLEAFFNAVLFVDEDHTVASCNQASAKMIGLPRREIIGVHIGKFLVKGIPQSHRAKLFDASTISDNFNYNSLWRGVSIVTAKGTNTLVDLSTFDIVVGNRRLKGLVMDDISERLKSANDYQASLQRFDVLTSLAPVGIVQINHQWECTYVNDKWCEFTQSTPDESFGVTWMDGIHPSDAEQVLLELRAQTTNSGEYEGEFRLVTPLGKITWVKANGMSLYDSKGKIAGLIMTFSDVSAHRLNEQRLEHIASTDQLTGLVNRTFFNDRIDQALKGVPRYGKVAVMFIDLDDFKHINDSLGHDFGDTLLVEVAQRLKRTLRDVDTIARIGGDEFTVILTHADSAAVISSVADKLLKALARPFEIEHRRLFVTCSIGIALAEQPDTEAKALLKQADIALYKAKEAGRNQYRHYTSDLDKEVNYHIHLRHSLRDPKRHDFYIHYQPQYDAESQKLIGFEALCRWRHEEVQPIGPDKFVAMIEQFGLINEFSQLILQQIFADLKLWHADYPEFQQLKISINLSAKQFKNRELATSINNLCITHGIRPHNITLEITETALIEDPTLALKTLYKLKQWGFGLSLDDFGTGYSSLAYMHKLPLDSVKIDKSFIIDLEDNPDDAKIVTAIIQLSNSLGLSVIAEGVESEQTSRWLQKNGCNLHQGFYFGKPMELKRAQELHVYCQAGDNTDAALM
ncbi:bifunctional diguanylate cyclase/phosphodiesterase [Halioxenophilus aromaticivorans]|uniref:EAL domain-containing protein n=1 Tax=Halioxenophilus aromaticivorans TaxID=1306992 RepID=A0AAV3U3I0_9ALTE